MDGVLWRGDTPLPGLAELFDTLNDKQINYVLATNNATKTAVMYTERLAGYGVTVPPEKIVTSAEATAGYLAEQYAPGTAVYPVGDKGLRDALTAKGFTLLSMEAVFKGATAPLVVAGFFRGLSYELLAAGALLLTKGARFVGTNPDVSFPSEYGRLPGAGAVQAFLSAATGIEPEIVGKPERIMYDQAVKRLGGSPETTAMVGDRLNTDMAGALNAGLRTILVLSGITQPDDLDDSSIQPEFVFDDIVALRQALENGKLA